MGQMMDRINVLSTVSQSGICQSLLMGEILLSVHTSATMFGSWELEENKKITTLRTKNSLLLNSSNQMHFMAPCLTFFLGKLSLPDCGVDLGSEVVEDRRVVGVLREQ